MHHHRRKGGEWAVWIFLTYCHPQAITHTCGNPEAERNKCRPVHKRQQRKHEDRQHGERNHLADFRDRAMFQQVLGPAAAIGEILLEERHDAGPRIIGHAGLVGHPDAEPGFAQPEIQLRILIVAEALVITADRIESGNPHQRVVAVIDPMAFRAFAVLRATIAELGILGDGRGLLEQAVADRIHGDDDGVRTRPLGVLDQPLAIIIGIIAMGVDADEVIEILAEGGDGKIDACALDTLRVGKKRDAFVLCRKGGNDVARSIRAAAIGNDDAEQATLHRAGEFDKQPLDRLRLIEAGYDDQRSDAGMTETFHDLPPTHYTGENCALRAWPEADLAGEDNCCTSRRQSSRSVSHCFLSVADRVWKASA
ncbi:Hypothetical protein AT6N2_L0622 [Agrobacterium tumefaciens]|nr:Hypothetical protein AT6N2_L0622 [Agrobacterium tumefaciens]